MANGDGQLQLELVLRGSNLTGPAFDSLKKQLAENAAALKALSDQAKATSGEIISGFTSVGAGARRLSEEEQQARKAAADEAKRLRQEERTAARAAADEEKRLAKEKAAAEKQASKEAADAAKQARQEEELAAQDAAQNVNSALQGVSQGLGGAIPLGIAAATAAVVAFVASSVRSFNDFEQTLRQVNAALGDIGQAGDENLSRVGGQVRDLAQNLGVDANESAKTLLSTIREGFPDAGAAMDIVTTASRASVAGFGEQQAIAKTVAETLQAYHQPAADAATVTDELAKASQLSGLSLDAMASGIGRVAPTAAAAGIPLNQLLAAIAEMVKQGIPAGQAFTSLERVLSTLIAPTREQKAEFDALGIATGEQAFQGRTLSQVFADLIEKTGGHIELVDRMVGGQRTFNSVLAASVNGGRDLADAEREIADASGTVIKAHGEVEKSGSRAWQHLAADVNEAKLRVGEFTSPTMTMLAELVDRIGAHAGLWKGMTPTDEQVGKWKDLDRVAEVWVGLMGFIAQEAPKLALGITGIESAAQDAGEALGFALVTKLTAAGKATEDARSAQDRLADQFEQGKISAETYDAAMAALAQREAGVKDVEDRRATSLTQLAQRTSALADVEDHRARAMSELEQRQGKVLEQQAALSNAGGLYGALLGNLSQLLDSGAISHEEYAKRLDLLTSELQQGKLALDQETLAFISGTQSAQQFGQALLAPKEELKSLTQAQYEQKLRDIANAIQFGAVTAEQGQRQIRELANAYEQQLTEAARKSVEHVRKVNEANKQVLGDARTLQEDLARIERDGADKVQAIRDKHDDEFNAAIIAATEKQTEIKEKAADDEIKTQEEYGERELKIEEEIDERKAGHAKDQIDRQLRMKRQAEDEAIAITERDEARREALAAADQRRTDERAKAIQALSDLETTLAQERAQADDARADAAKKADDAERKSRDDAERRLKERTADEDQRLSQDSARAQAGNARSLADEETAYQQKRAETTQKLLEQVGTRDLKAKQAAADELQRYQEQLDQETLRHGDALDKAKTDAAKVAETDQHQDAIARIDREHADKLAKQAELYGDRKLAEDQANFDALHHLDIQHVEALNKLKEKAAAEALARQQAHDDAIAKAKREHDDALAALKERADEEKKARDDAHTDALAKIADRETREKDRIEDEQTRAIKAIDDQEKKRLDTEKRQDDRDKTKHDLQAKREKEDDERHDKEEMDKLAHQLADEETKRKAALKAIEDRRDKEIAASNDALTKKQEQIDSARDKDLAKFSEDTKKRLDDLQQQFTDRVNKLDELIPDHVKKLLGLISGNVAATASSLGQLAGTNSTNKDGNNSSGQDGASGKGAAALAAAQNQEDELAFLRQGEDEDEILAQLRAQLAASNPSNVVGQIGGDAAYTPNWRPPVPISTGGANAGSALAWAERHLGRAEYQGYCEQFVENSFGVSGVYPSAEAARRALLTHPGGTLAEAPRGAIVFFRPDSSNGFYGHVGISEGGGQFISAINSGVAIQGMSPYWNRLYSGYSINAPGQRTQAFGDGGVLREPIVGLGLQSGDRYVFRERGEDEIVTPKSRIHGSGRGDVHYHRHNHLTVTGSPVMVNERVLANYLNEMDLLNPL